MSAPETEYKDVLWLGEGPKPEKRRRRWRHSGSPFLWLLSFGEAKESTLLCCTGTYEFRESAGCAVRWVNHPLGLIYYIDNAPTGATNYPRRQL